MSYHNDIILNLQKAFKTQNLLLENESFMHNVPADSETHFKLVIVSNDFLGLTKVKRHQKIYNVLSQTMNQIHALSIQAFTIDEYQKNPIILQSPDCSNK